MSVGLREGTMRVDKVQIWTGHPCARDVEADALYEFLWVGSFDPPVFARVTRAGEKMVALGCTGSLRRQGFSSAFEWLEAIFSTEPTRTSRTLDSSEWARIETLVDAAGFWDMDRNSERSGLDGGDWTVRGLRGREYHEVHRWSPESVGFRDLALHIAGAAGFDLDLY